MTTLSAVVPVHNGAATLADTLTSLQRNASSLQGVIVVDDASMDRSVEIAEAHPLQPRVIRLGENRGVAYSRNTGLIEATGDYVAFIDQDDMWLPGRAARLLEYLTPDADQVLITSEQVFAATEDRDLLEEMAHPFTSWIEHWRPRDQICTLLDDIKLQRPLSAPTVIPPSRIVSGSVTVTTSYALPRRLALQVGGFASWIKAADDWVLLQALSPYAEIRKLDDRSVLYRVHPSNTSVKVDWPIPLAAAAAAIRRGGGVVPTGLATDASAVGRLGDSEMLMHQLRQSARSPGQRLDTIAAWRLLSTDRSDQIGTLKQLTRSAIAGWGPARKVKGALNGRPRRAKEPRS